MEQKLQKKRFCFLDNSISIGSLKLSLLQRECLSSVVKVLTNSPKSPDITKREIFRFWQSEEQIQSMYRRADFGSVWDPLACCMSKGVLKRSFLEIYLIKFSSVRNFENTAAMRVILF